MTFFAFSLILALLSCILCTVSAESLDIQATSSERYCRRRFQFFEGQGNYTIAAMGSAACISGGGFVAGQIRHIMNSKPLPQFTTHAWANKGDQSSAVGAAFGAVWGIDRIVEYKEDNGKIGFQELADGSTPADTIVKNYYLRDAILPSGAHWSPLDVQREDSASGTVFRVTTQLQNPAFASLARFGLLFSTRQVTVQAPNATERVVLVPNGVKSTFELQDLVYTDGTGVSKLAIGVHLLTESDIRRRNTSVPAGDVPPNPDDSVSGRQEVIDLDNGTGLKAFFNFQPFAAARFPNGTRSQATLQFSNSGSFTNQFSDSTITNTFGLKLRRLWFSFNDRVSAVAWDPTLGSPEGTADNSVDPTTNSAHWNAATAFIGIFVAMVVAIVAMLF